MESSITATSPRPAAAAFSGKTARFPAFSGRKTEKKAKLNLIIDIIAKIWYYKTKGDDANGLMKHTTKYNFLSKGGSP